MTAALLDTHAWAWLLNRSARLSARVIDCVESASPVLVSPVSFFEIAQKVRLGKWPEMEPYVARLPTLLREQGGGIAALTEDICLAAGLMEWPHRDPFDRLLASTAIASGSILVSIDPVFDDLVGVAGWLGRVW